MDEGAWDGVYRDLVARGHDAEGERREAAWLDPVLDLAWADDPRDGVPGTVLDLGCGLGGDLAYLAERGWRGHGLELEPVAVAEARRRLRPAGVEVTRADLRRPLPFPDAAFDLAISKLALHALTRDEAATLVREAGRVLAPDGVLAFLVNSDAHRRLGLQYDYAGAEELEPGTWRLPSLGRVYRFYTSAMARELLAGWRLLDLSEGPYVHWGIAKRVLRCVARRPDPGDPG